MNHSQLITNMEARGIPVSPFMTYWTLTELLHYFNQHIHTTTTATTSGTSTR